MGKKRNRIKIQGVVQGVGFRPTVYKYALEHSLVGFVLNSAQGVFIEIEGKEKDLDNFLDKLQKHPPPLSRITTFEVDNIPVAGSERFIIKTSEEGDNLNKEVAVSPDIAICDACAQEISDPQNRRYGYAFTNCTNCGPRFTIIHDRPYDRHLTSMASFTMCKQCTEEYENPLNRRFHAQPNCCADCGPVLTLLGVENCADLEPQEYFIDEIRQGAIAALKGLGGFNIACDPFSASTVARLRRAKNRPEKALALMAPSVEEIRKYCEVSSREEDLLRSAVAPIVLLKKINSVLDHICPDNNYLGFMLPYTPLHQMILAQTGILVMTSANLKDEPIASTDREVEKLLDLEICDFALSHNRDIVRKCDDSIVMVVRDKVMTLRRSRGIVPTEIKITANFEEQQEERSISFGANQKNTFALRKGERIYLSQHIGELIDVRNVDFMLEQVRDFTSFFEVKPQKIKLDAHPGYAVRSVDYRIFGQKAENDKEIEIYHHHAHLLSAMAENNLLGKKVVGIICDGTGYGRDGTVWGCEFLQVGRDWKEFVRRGHLRPFPLPGGDKAARETDRCAFSLLQTAQVEKPVRFMTSRYTVFDRMLEQKINSPLCSSAGRLFDGIASLIGLVDKAGYEAQAAMKLQKEAELFYDKYQFDLRNYPLQVKSANKDHLIIGYSEMLNCIIDDLEDQVPLGEIAFGFHSWFAASLFQTAQLTGEKLFVLSGGVFQNRLLLELLLQLFADSPLQVYLNQTAPTNDGGIALGQSVY
ncbi:MAG: carbamoyltransferase HypF [Deltaproteobacteria bacterium]|jgi:hydrogenase maturation protein HypF|nr:carbamoyltransferase HypF [Deltaproteobacteria bacterium]